MQTGTSGRRGMVAYVAINFGGQDWRGHSSRSHTAEIGYDPFLLHISRTLWWILTNPCSHILRWMTIVS